MTWFARHSSTRCHHTAKAALAQVKLGDPKGALELLAGLRPTSVEGRLCEALAYSGAAALGAADPAQARFRAWIGVGMAFVVAAVSAVLIALFRQQIAWAYTNDLAVAALAAQLLIFAALFQLPDAVQVSTSCAIRAYKVTRAPMLIHLTAFWGLCLPLGVVLGLAPDWLPWRPAQAMAAQGFWIALVAGLTIAALGLTWLLKRLSDHHVADETRL